MAHHKSAFKRIRQTDVRTERNRARRSRIRTFVKKVELAVTEGDQAKANEALRVAQSELTRGVTKGVYKKNTASRKISRLNAQVKSLSA
ncbi:30S ribosomal protein S20 [Sneathiella sp.]|uniref:30S ribosomal protein S20 n=1 Tax=Sneathiella sp. TaxID=1964365 RepID=UPI003569B219